MWCSLLPIQDASGRDLTIHISALDHALAIPYHQHYSLFTSRITGPAFIVSGNRNSLRVNTFAHALTTGYCLSVLYIMPVWQSSSPREGVAIRDITFAWPTMKPMKLFQRSVCPKTQTCLISSITQHICVYHPLCQFTETSSTFLASGVLKFNHLAMTFILWLVWHANKRIM